MIAHLPGWVSTAASILVARKLAQHDGGKQVPATVAAISDVVRWALYLARYDNSRYWVDFEDFSFYRMDVLDVYYVGGSE